MSDGGAFIHVGTDAAVAAAEFEAAMRRIQTASGMLHFSDAELAGQMNAVAQPLSQIEERTRRMQERIKSLLTSVGTGAVDPVLGRPVTSATFKRDAQREVGQAVADTGKMFGEGLSRMPRDVLRNLNAKAIWQEIIGEIQQGGERALEANRGLAGGKLLRTTLWPTEGQETAAFDAAGRTQRSLAGRATLSDQLFESSMHPFGSYGGDNLSRYAQLLRQDLMESLIREETRNVIADPANGIHRLASNSPFTPAEIAQQLGLTQEYVAMKEPRYGLLRYEDNNAQGMVTGINPTNTAALLKEAEQRLNLSQQAAISQNRGVTKSTAAFERETKAAERAGEAIRQYSLSRMAVEHNFEKLPGGRFADPAGGFLKTTVAGADEITNPIRIQQAAEAQRKQNEELAKRNTEEANYRRILTQGGRVGDSTNYVVGAGPSAEVYRLVGENRAVEVTGLAAQKVLDQIDSSAQRLAQTQGKTAESAHKLNQEFDNYNRVAAEGRRVGSSDNFLVGDEAARSAYRVVDANRAVALSGLQADKVFKQQDEAIRRALSSEENLARVRQTNAIKEAQRNSGLLGGFLGRFQRGEMNPVTQLGAQVASAAAFSFAYGSLFAVQHAVRDTMAEFQDYQDSITDLEVATRSADVVTNDWVNTLSELARFSGSNVGAALDAAARGVRAFTDPLTDSKAKVQAVGTATAEASTKLALIANKDMRDATGDLIAITSAYQLAPEQISNVVEAVAQAKRTLGGDPAQISQGLAIFGGAANEAGMDPQTAANIISLVQARTDQSGLTVATRLARMFQIITGSTGKTLAAETGVNPDLSVFEQLGQYSKIYNDPNTTKAQRDRITSGLGGTANLKELLPLLKEYDRLLKAHAEELAHAGAAQNEFGRKTDNMVGTLLKMRTDIKNIQVDLARTNLFAPIGAGIKVLEPALHGLDLLIKAFGTVTGQGKAAGEAFQTAFGFAATTAIAAKAIAVVKTRQSLYRATQAAALSEDMIADVMARTGATRLEVQSIMTAAEQRAAAETGMNRVVLGSMERRAAAEGASAAAGAVGNKVGFMGGLAALGRFLLNPWVLGISAVVGGLAATAKIKEGHDKRNAMYETENNALTAYKRTDNSAASLRATADQLRIAAGNIKETKTGGLFDMGNSDQQRGQVAGLNARAKQLDQLAKQVTAEDRLAASEGKVTAFGSDAIDTFQQLADGMDNIAAAGGTAVTQMRLLRKALLTEPREQRQTFQPAHLNAEIQTAFMATLPHSVPKQGTVVGEYQLSQLELARQHPDQAQRYLDAAKNNRGGPLTRLGHAAAVATIANMNTPAMLTEAFNEAINDLHLEGKTHISQGDKARLARAMGQKLDLNVAGADAQDVLKNWVNNAIRYMGKHASGAPGVAPDLLNGKTLSGRQLNAILNGTKDNPGGYVKWQQAVSQMIPGSDNGPMQIAEAKANLQTLRAFKAKATDDFPQLDYLIAQAEHDLAVAQMKRIDDIRLAKESQAKTTKELRAVRLHYAKIEAVQAHGDPVQLETLFESLDRQTIRAVIAYLKAQAAIVKMALDHLQKMRESAALLLRMTPDGPVEHGQGTDGADANKADQAERLVYKYDKLLTDINTAIDVFQNRSTVTDKKAKLPKTGGSGSKPLTAAQQAALLTQATTDPDNTVGTAKAALDVAKANLAAIKNHHTSEYFSALQSVTQAEDALAKAIASHAGAAAQVNAARLNSPLANAKAQLTAAAATLRASAKGTDAWLQALASFYQAQWAMRDAVVQYQNNLDLLRGDSTDPVEQARDALRAARRKLASDRRGGAGKDVITGDRVEAQNARNQEEAARFSQRLQDAQTANQLGQMSFKAYMAYLDHEHDRLSRIKHKTRQQKDELNQIDQAIKDANSSLEGQFNIGDINVNGLVYQARRYAAEQKARMASAQVQSNHTTNQTVSIQIDGADTAKVRRIIDEYVGRPGRVRTAQPRRY